MAGNAIVSWDAITDSNLGGYRIYYGSASRTYSANLDVGKATSYTIENLQEGATYYFSVTAYDINKTSESPYSTEVSKSVPVPTSASFTASITSGPAPLMVTFTPTTTGSITGWRWDFGDGTSNSGTGTSVPTPIKSYDAAGTYPVSLTVTGTGGVTTTTAPALISVAAPIPPAPVADFSTTSVSGVAPLTVQFSDASTGSISAWAWSFGDGASSTSQNPAHTYQAAGTYDVSLTVTGPGGSNVKTHAGYIVASPASVSVPSRPDGLVAAYGFEELSGPNAVDSAGSGNHGVITGATRITSGRFGKALSFNGLSNWVTVSNSASLNPSTGLTLEAWVYPTAVNNPRAIMVKEDDAGNAAYYLYGSTANGVPGAAEWIGGEKTILGPSALRARAWSHVATTYDGTYQRLYVNGSEVARKALSGTLSASAGALRIGANSVWGDYFQGYIDEVRIYSRARTATEIQTDATNAVSKTTPPVILIGEQITHVSVDGIPQRVAKAFQMTAQKSGMVSSVRVYVSSRTASSVRPLVGVYADNNGHPGRLLTQGTATTLRLSSWNDVAVPPVSIAAGDQYWVAVMSPQGTLWVRDRLASGLGLSERMATGSQLPTAWSSSATFSADGPASMVGLGN